MIIHIHRLKQSTCVVPSVFKVKFKSVELSKNRDPLLVQAPYIYYS